ncbi:FAD dependent oxidoreductase [Thelonectria olida]|uniref:FAD dependent oxidoreductase n=1 Tax=Thelonectria olida TaxID=1576542 RepID=A0A9P8VWV1_9HYPO|nr:FAD dependent oxidoreductase [Thelonectria olida]
MSNSPDGIYEKGVIDPGFPVKNSTKPFWLTEPSKISKLRSPWTESADIVIIGSGMTAASLANTLYSKRADQKIVIVEARDLCSGATGRNGGHLKAMSPGSWFERKEQFGVQEAVRIMEYEHSHLEEMVSCIKTNKLECDLNLLEGLDVYHDEKVFRNAVNAVEDMQRHAPSLGALYKIYTVKEDLKARNCPDACVGAIGMPAASMWPYKMVTGLFEKMVRDNGLFIQTNTLVTAVFDEEADFATVKTDRGEIRAKHVVHATNSWIGRLVPELRPFVSPVRANVQRRMPKPTEKRLDNSWWIRYGEHDYEYMIQRPDGAYIVGRANTGRRATADDSEVDFLAHSHLRGVTPLVYDFGTQDIETTHAWSGAVAFTWDGNPFVGRLPFAGRRHQWICGAYSGIGMVRAFRSAQLLGLLLLGEEVPSVYPRSMLLTDARVEGWKGEISSKL